ncbi:MAG: BolA/IbaG family iron-sulfur metabolism protein [Sulfuricella sp.]|jgi:acid stress-induced BolA-like protein IbaG/YrbA|nr:BolA/IbaG family iron-sulfur metabolism protein [Gammaproteobacteria bacterium]MBU1732563.1 BolA/IbaG family iron-sulfur metabolism protein [Gammaproteobacteria bacterium]MBU1893426.1 BolA/IbaG family iron-sulfur metabolism protein [Gammaproteobacteria bacterium]
MVTADQIKQYIQNDLPCEYVRVDGDDGQHFEAVIVSAEFNGKRTVQQHQLVYKALGERMGGEIHALAMKTFTPEEWRKQAG